MITRIIETQIKRSKCGEEVPGEPLPVKITGNPTAMLIKFPSLVSDEPVSDGASLLLEFTNGRLRVFVYDSIHDDAVVVTLQGHTVDVESASHMTLDFEEDED